MSDAAANRTPVRQWRITITEGQLPGLYLVGLGWRTFPCRASEWDGQRYSQFVTGGPRIESPDDLRDVLLAAVEGDWYEDVRHARPRRT